MNIRPATKKVFSCLLFAIAGLSVIQVTSYEAQNKKLEFASAESTPYLKVPLPSDISPFQARMLLNGLPIQPGNRITLITSPFLKKEVDFLLSLTQDAFKDIEISVSRRGPDILLILPNKPQLKDKVIFINTWDGMVEIGLSRIESYKLTLLRPLKAV